MATHVITSLISRIDFAPESVAAEVVQNVRAIIATQVGTVPLFRDFGVSWEGIDRPLPVARAIVQAAIIEAIEKYEPRAVVDSVTWPEGDDAAKDAMDGIMRPTVTVSLAEGLEDATLVTDRGVTVSSLYQVADKTVYLATSVAKLEESIGSRFVELEISDYVRIFNLGESGYYDGGVLVPVAISSGLSGASVVDTIAIMIDLANKIASQVRADCAYYRKIFHEFERIDYAAIYRAGTVEPDIFDVSDVEPAYVSSAVGIRDLEELNLLATTAFASVIAARDELLEVERMLGEFERTDFISIYEQE